MRNSLVASVVGLLLCLPTPGWGADPQFDEGVKLLRELEYVRAIQAFEKALERPGSTAAERAQIHVQIGIARSGLTEYDAAEVSFKKALNEDRTIQIPNTTSPKIRALFERVRAELLAPASPTVSPPPVETPPVSPIDADADTEDDLATEKKSGTSTNWPAWITLGVGVAAGGAGLAMGLLNRSEKDKARDTSMYFDEAQGHADNAASYGLAANILLGVAGAAVVTSGVLFYLGRKKSAADVSAAVVPTLSGVVVQVGLRR